MTELKLHVNLRSPHRKNTRKTGITITPNSGKKKNSEAYRKMDRIIFKHFENAKDILPNS